MDANPLPLELELEPELELVRIGYPIEYVRSLSRSECVLRLRALKPTWR